MLNIYISNEITKPLTVTNYTDAQMIGKIGFCTYNNKIRIYTYFYIQFH